MPGFLGRVITTPCSTRTPSAVMSNQCPLVSALCTPVCFFLGDHKVCVYDHTMRLLICFIRFMVLGVSFHMFGIAPFMAHIVSKELQCTFGFSVQFSLCPEWQCVSNCNGAFTCHGCLHLPLSYCELFINHIWVLFIHVSHRRVRV